MNKLSGNIKSHVVPALVEAGLPLTSVEQYLAAVQTQSVAAIERVPGIKPAIIQAGTLALTQAYAQAFKITWLATIAFGACSFIAACLSRDIDAKLSHDVIRRLSVGYGKRKDHSDDSDHEKQGVERVESITS